MTRRGKLRLGLGIVLLLGAAYAAYYARVEVRLREELRLFHEAGFPTNREELLAMYAVPADPDNGAEILEKAFALFPEDSDYPPWDQALIPVGGRGQFPDPSGPLPDDVRQAIGDYLAAHRAAIPLLHEGARKPLIRFAPRPAPSPDKPLDLIWHGRCEVKGVDALLVEAAFLGDGGDAQGALDGMVDAKAIADSLEQLPGSFATVALARCQRDWMATLAYLLGRKVLAGNELEALASLLDDGCKPDQSSRPLAEMGAVVESVLGTSWSDVRQAVDNGDFGEASPQRSDWVDNLVSVTYLFVYMPGRLHCRDAIHYMGLLRELARAENTSTSMSELLGHYRLASSQARHLPHCCRTSKILIPGLEHAAAARLGARSLFPCARAALAVEQYRAATGTLPDSLEALVPGYLDAVPDDPWAPVEPPAALKYTHGTEGYTVYSAGIDRQDNGGDPAGGGGNARDICFIVGKGGPLPSPDVGESVRPVADALRRRLGDLGR